MKFSKEELKKSLLLYAVTDRSWLGEESLYDQVEQVIKGGTTFVQLREKELDQAHFLEEGKEIQKLCRQYKVPFVINDNVDIAAAIDADGVHVGQSDMKALDVRRKLGPDKIIGVSAQTVEQAVYAEQQGADYLGVGAVFPTGSKADAVEVSHEMLKAICRAVRIPVIAIGGIGGENVEKLSGSGICGIAVISALFAKENKEEAARQLRKKTEEMVRSAGGVIFDMDGTLLDSMEVWEHAGTWYLEKMGRTAEPDLGRTLFAMSMEEGARYLKQSYALSGSISEIIDGINEVIFHYYAEQVPLKAGVKEFLSHLKKKGMRITVATSSDRTVAEAAFSRLGIASYIEKIFTCTEVGKGKSEPEIYIEAARYMECAPEAVWVFEDALYAIRTAKAAGFRTAGVFDAVSRNDTEAIRKTADIYLETFEFPEKFI